MMGRRQVNWAPLGRCQERVSVVHGGETWRLRCKRPTGHDSKHCAQLGHNVVTWSGQQAAPMANVWPPVDAVGGGGPLWTAGPIDVGPEGDVGGE